MRPGGAGPGPEPGSGAWGLLFRAALRIHPPRWRERFAREAAAAFDAGFARRRKEEGTWPALRYAARAVADTVLAVRRERRTDGARRTPEAGAPTPGLPPERGSGGRRGEGTIGGDGPWATLGWELRRAARRLRRTPGLTAAVAVILALGVGVNAGVFTVLRRAVVAPLPFPEAERLVLPRWATVTRAGVPDTVFGLWSYPRFLELRAGAADAFEGVAGYAVRSATVTDPGDAESVALEFVTPGYFQVLGVGPVVGRFFTAGEEGRDAPPGVVVLSHGFWVERFGADPGAVGRTLTADGERLEIVGVAPPGFRGLTGSPRFWLPLGQARHAYGAWATESRVTPWFHAVGRLRPGVSAEAAEERVAALARAIDAVESRLDPGEEVHLDVTPLASVRSNPETRASVWLAMAAAVLVLAIAVANVAALLLARGRREARETAVRLALGAGKSRLVRERLVEGLLLGGLGGAAGLLLARAARGAMRAAIPEHLFRSPGGDVLLVDVGAFGVDAGVALFGLAVALAAGAIFGAVPALVQGTVDVAPTLRRSGARTVGGTDGGRWLVGGQVAVSVVLLVSGGLLLASLNRLHREQTGFDPARLLVLRYSLGGPDGRYREPGAVREFHRTFRDRVAALPGVRSAALGTTPPLSGGFIRTRVTRVVGRAPFPEGRRPPIGAHVVDERFFGTLGTRLLRGRTFTADEIERSEGVAVLSRRAADDLFPGGSPLGREIVVPFSGLDRDHALRVVGVVEDVLYASPVEGMGAEIYLPMSPWPPPSVSLHVRTEGDPLELVPAARAALRALDPEIPFWRVTTGMELRREDVADTRLLVLLLGLFAGLAVVLATTGIWAVVARAVAERRREIGLRMALGARAAEVEALVFRQGLTPIVVGGSVGLAAAGAAAPLLRSVLFGVGPRDAAVFAGAAAVLVAAALLATWLPARRAARVDPLEALAGE